MLANSPAESGPRCNRFHRKWPDRDPRPAAGRAARRVLASTSVGCKDGWVANKDDNSGRVTERPSVIHEGLPTQLPDIDPDETREWLESLDEMIDERGRERARYVMLKLLERSREKQVGVPAL